VPMEKPKSESMVSMPILDAEHTECKVEVLTTQSHIQLRGVMTLIKLHKIKPIPLNTIKKKIYGEWINRTTH